MWVILSCKKESNAEKLATIIKTYETKREYDFDKYQSVENTTKFYQAEADFSLELKKQLEQVSIEGLSETEEISRTLLLFVLQDKIDTNTYKMYLNTITNETAFHLRLNNIADRTLNNKSDVITYLEQLDKLPQKVHYNLDILRETIKEGITQPNVIFHNYDTTYGKHIVSEVTTSDFYKPFKILPKSLSSAVKDSIIGVAKKSIQENVVQQYKKIKSFFFLY